MPGPNADPIPPKQLTTGKELDEVDIKQALTDLLDDTLAEEKQHNPEVLEFYQQQFDLPIIEGEVLDKEISVTFENGSGKELVKTMTVAQRQRQLQKKSEMIKKLLTRLYA